MLHSSFNLGAVSGVISVSSLFQPVRCASPPKLVHAPRLYCANAHAADSAAMSRSFIPAINAQYIDCTDARLTQLSSQYIGKVSDIAPPFRFREEPLLRSRRYGPIAVVGRPIGHQRVLVRVEHRGIYAA